MEGSHFTMKTGFLPIVGIAMIVAGFTITSIITDSLPEGMPPDYYESYGIVLSITHNTGIIGIPVFVAGIILLLHQSRRVPHPFFAGIASYGMITGAYLALNWNDEGIHILLNVPAMLLGDHLHTAAIQTIGDPSSSRAFFTIPWILRQPFVYILSSIVFWIPLGFGVQRVIDYTRKGLSPATAQNKT